MAWVAESFFLAGSVKEGDLFRGNSVHLLFIACLGWG
jgi:hypothetical protein